MRITVPLPNCRSIWVKRSLKGGLTLGIGLGVSAAPERGLRAGLLLLAHLRSAPCLMRFEPATVGRVADGTKR